MDIWRKTIIEINNSHMNHRKHSNFIKILKKRENLNFAQKSEIFTKTPNPI
jgi:hypothetical protein